MKGVYKMGMDLESKKGKYYRFNNIGWGLSNDITSRHGATTMFQEIIHTEAYYLYLLSQLAYEYQLLSLKTLLLLKYYVTHITSLLS